MSVASEAPNTLVLTCDIPACGRQQSFQNGGRTEGSCRAQAAEFGWYCRVLAGTAVDVCPFCCSAAIANHIAVRS